MAAKEYEYEKTLMYGHYSELQQFAREFAASREHPPQHEPPNIEEARRRRKKAWRIWNWLSNNILPYIVDWLFVLVLGILMAALSFLIDYVIEKIAQAHVVLSLQLSSHLHVVLQYFLWVGFSLLFVLFSIGFVQVVSIHAIGSGIPEMKTVLRGISLTDYLTFRTFVSKTVALVTAVGSGLPIGKEGPFVHLSSIIAHIMSKCVTTINRVYANEAHNNELLAAACAVGVSCNFAAPIGGVLFSIEVTATYFAVRNYWRGFFGAVCGAFLFRLAAVWFKSEETITALFKTSFRPDFPFDLQELIAFAFIGVAAGFGGAFFVWCHRMYVLGRRKYRNITKLLRLDSQAHLRGEGLVTFSNSTWVGIFILPALVTILFTTLTFPPGTGQFMAGELTQRGAIDQLFSNKPWINLPSPSEVMDLPEDSEDYQIMRQWGTPNIFVTLILYILVRFFFTAISISLPIPSGVYFPVFVIGAAFGRLIGETMATWFPHGINGNPVLPGGYAVVGAAAMAGSVTHTISTSVIVFELTGQITHILPVMIAVLIANAICSWLQPSFYDSIILLKKLSYLPDLKPNTHYDLFVTDFMRRNLVYLSYRSTYLDLKQLLLTSNYASYPLVDAPDSRILIGSLSRHNLKAMLDDHMKGVHKHAQQIRDQSQLQSDTEEDSKSEQPSSPKRTVMSPDRTPSPGGVEMLKKITFMPHSLAKIFGAQDEPDSAELEGTHTEEALEELREELLSQTIDFKKGLIDPAPFQVVERTSLYKIHSLFSILALSHTYVTSIGRLVGVVTLQDLTDAIEGKKKPPSRDETDTSALEMVQMAETDSEVENPL